MQIKATYLGKSYVVERFGIADLVAFERHFGCSAADFEDPNKTRFEYLCFMVHRGLRKQVEGLAPYGDEFLDGVDDIELTTEVADEETVPLDPAAPVT